MKTRYFDGDTFERNGVLLRVNFQDDDTQSAPWEWNDGHGPVSDWTRRDKRSGELVLTTDRGFKRFYDLAEANRTAKRDGWGLNDDERAALARKLGRDPTRGEIRAESVRRDYEHLRRWCAGQWNYIGVIVTPLCMADDEPDDDTPNDYAFSLWGVESDSGAEYLAEIIDDLADEASTAFLRSMPREVMP
jgi:hypothetical protein